MAWIFLGIVILCVLVMTWKPVLFAIPIILAWNIHPGAALFVFLLEMVALALVEMEVERDRKKKLREATEPSLSLWGYLKDCPPSALVDSPAPAHRRQQEVIQRLQRLVQ